MLKTYHNLGNVAFGFWGSQGDNKILPKNFIIALAEFLVQRRIGFIASKTKNDYRDEQHRRDKFI